MLSETENTDLTIEEQEAVICKFQGNRSLTSKEVKFLLSFTTFEENRLGPSRQTLKSIDLYKKYKQQIRQQFQGLEEQKQINSIQLQMEKGLRSDAGLSILKYAAYLKFLGRQLVFTDYSKKGEYAFWDVKRHKNDSLLPNSDLVLKTDYGELRGQTGSILNSALMVIKKWESIPGQNPDREDEIRAKIDKLIFFKYDLSGSFLSSFNDNDEAPDNFVLSKLNQIRFRLVDHQKSSDNEPNGIVALEKDSSHEQRLTSTIRHKLKSEEDWTPPELELLIQETHFSKLLFFMYLQENLQKAKTAQIRRELFNGKEIDVDFVEVRILELLQSKGLSLFDLAAYLGLLGRILTVVKSEKRGFVFYQIPYVESLKEKFSFRPFYICFFRSPCVYDEAAKFVNRGANASLGKVIKPIFTAGQSFLRGFDFMRRRGVEDHEILYHLASRCIFRSFPKKNGDGFHHRFYLKKLR
ncbi:MAG: hypothetical protein KI786_15330 [Mameliella sp.]|nr:hypothetical protein [Phaeodactylibacter sp.]